MNMKKILFVLFLANTLLCEPSEGMYTRGLDYLRSFSLGDAPQKAKEQVDQVCFKAKEFKESAQKKSRTVANTVWRELVPSPEEIILWTGGVIFFTHIVAFPIYYLCCGVGLAIAKKQIYDRYVNRTKNKIQ
jgi:hypothetical protein